MSIRKIFLYILFFELLSLIAYLFPAIGNPIFLIIVLGVLILSFKDLKYGLYFLIAELLIGSKGYLFFFEYGGFKISIRIVLWLIIMSVWLSKIIIDYYKNRKINITFLQSKFFYYFSALFLLIAWGLTNGCLQGNEVSNIFFDFNGWLYFLLVLPMYDLIKNNDDIKNSLNIFYACVCWLIFKTLFLLYFFSHNFYYLTTEVYRWIRTTGVGEITQMDGGFSRIFFQSHLFVLPAIFLFCFILLKYLKTNNKQFAFTNKKFFTLLILGSLLFSVIIITLSRSFWVGLTAGAVAILIILLQKRISFFNLVSLASITCLSVFLSGILIIGIIKLPWPTPITEVGATNIIAERATQITGEAGASSRWLLLPELWQEIKASPIIGQGFGKTVTYISQDPRVLESSSTGEYTAYAFEWGWLDVWLKIGVLGLITYLALITKMIACSLKKTNDLFNTIAAISLICLTAVNIFSPYVNHPLGIGFLIFLAIFIEKFSYQQKALA